MTLESCSAEVRAALPGRQPPGKRPGAVVLPKRLTQFKPEKIKGGQQCYNYRLTPPAGLKLRPKPGDTNFITVADRRPWQTGTAEQQKGIGYRLEALLEQHKDKCRGADVHWAACRVVKQR
jgi:hypothetical protein